MSNFTDKVYLPPIGNISEDGDHYHDGMSWEPLLQKFVETATERFSYIVSVYLVVIFLFVVIKTSVSHGFGIWLLYKTGKTKFPKRPEIIVIFCSTLPTMLTIQSRSALKKYHNITVDIGYTWGSCQTVLFFDIFARTAAIYHMLYWTYSPLINRILLRFYLFCVGNQQDSNKESLFKLHCKRRFPILIYFLSFVVSVPILILARKIEKTNGCLKIPAYEFYHYYDVAILIFVPMVLMIVRFYSSALDRNKNMKMIYRLRCYHVTFVLLTIPIFVLSIVFEISRITGTKLDVTRFANGILISVTAYHTSFIIRPLVYTTGCNCICCGDMCLLRYPRVNRWVIYWSTPQHKEKANIYSQPIQVTID